MKKFFLISNGGKDPDFRYAKELAQRIRSMGGEASYMDVDGLDVNYRERLKSTIPEDTEVILVIGGDGTLIKAARDTMDMSLPLIGINLGKLGYLCELDEQNLYLALKLLLQDSYQVESRMMLTAGVTRDGKEIARDLALNDVVVHRSGALNIIGLEASVNGKFLSRYAGDGLIVSTPTGSTGYNMSSGGPIVEPQARMILLTPINPHDLNRNSIVFDGDAEIEIRIRGGKYTSGASIDVSFDGLNSLRLDPEDVITIQRASTETRILRLSNLSFLETLQKKMQRYA